MAQRILYVWVFVLLIITLKTDKTRSDSVNQPKIHLNKGNLILESSYDRNITVRLSHDSALYVNNVNVLEKLRQRYTPSAILDGDTKPSQQFTVDKVKSELHDLQEDLERLATRLITAQNRTRRTLQLRVIRRNLGRINRLNGRLLALERTLKKDECQELTEPCKNGGTCYDSYNGFHCECTNGYTGKTCEVDVDECYLLAGTDLGCQNNAACINTPGSYKCICAKGFSGTHCRLRNVICHQHLSGELCAHGSCVPANNAQGYTCICDQGWQRNTTTLVNGTNLPSLACDIDVNECEESRNPCFNECINLPGGFKCGPCPPGYTGNGVTCLDVDECAVNNGGCSVLPKVRCINTEGSYRCGNCPPGWLGDGHTCELAPSNSCNDQKICHPQAKCEYISEIPSCTCPPGMFGHGFGPQGCHTNPITDSCENHLCLNNGTCLAQGRTTSCLCPAGFSGALCEIASGCHPNPCENGGTCKPSGSDSFKCVCAMGTTGKRCEILRSICSRTLRRPAGELKYPTDDSPEYAFNEKCAWIIRTNVSEILNVTFTKFDLEESTDCNNDFLQIHDGNSLASQLIGRFCGQNLPLDGTILSSHNVLFFWFKSNNATNKPGFEMSWSSHPYICGEDLILSANEVGVIKSPGYPGKTPANRECQWQLTAPYGSRLVLRIYDVSLGSLANCSGDVLKIYDADLMLKQYCETSLAEVLHSSSNQVLFHFHTDRFSSDSAFQLHYAVEPGLPHCGGLYTEPKGFIMGPSQQATCLYLIQQPPGTQVKWEFLDFQTYENINCDLNRIEIFDGKTDEDKRLLLSCGDRKPEPVISSSNYMLVRFTSSLRVDSSQITAFKAKYLRACEFRVFGLEVGVLTTPNYPKPYIEHITCTFYIYGPGDTYVAANFTDVSLAETNPNDIADSTDTMENINNRTTSSNLNDDSITYMDVYLSKTNKRRYYKGAPMHLLAQSNEMIVVFHATTNAVKARGLRIEYGFQSKGCGSIFTGHNGSIIQSITTPFCVLTFTNDEGKHLKVDFSISGSYNGNTILIYANTTNNGDLLLRNTSSAYMVQETFNFNTVTMIILSRALIIGRYEFISTAHSCGGNFSTLYGAVTSPSWPRAYQANLDCVWIITAPLGNKIELQVHNFTLEPTCSGDILEIRNGKYPDSPLIGRYCQDRIPSRIASFTNSLYLRFTSDNYVEGPGFYLNWQQTSTGCGGKLTSYSGSIHTPHYDDEPEVWRKNNLKLTCDWLIVVSQGSVIDLSVTTAEDELAFCQKNNLRIYDGASTLNPLLRFNCSAILRGQHLLLKSTTNQLLIIYTLTEDSKYTSPEFLIDYETNCNTVIYDYRGVIESPNFPEDYPKNLNCNWHLKTGRNNKFQLVFSHFNVEVEDMDCEYDYVEIVDMKSSDVLKKRRLCFKPQEPIISQGNELIVHFVTDYSNPKEGFHMEFISVGCGEHLSKEFGSITSPNYPYSSDMDCDWYIEVAAGRQIFLTVVEFHLESENPNCGQNVLLFKESRNSSYELAKECQQQQVPLTVTSPANRLFIHFHTTAVRSRKFFKAVYHTKQATCGGSFRGTTGFISLANQPFVMGGNVDCTWDIHMPESYGIVLDFEQFELRNSPNCSENSIEFFINNIVPPKSLGKFCGSETPNLKTIHNNRIRIDYRERGHHEMANFTIRYRKQCGGLVTQTNGFLKSLATEDCRWEFDFQVDTLISLHIIQLDCYCPNNQTTALHCGHYLGIRRNNFDADIEPNDNTTLYVCERPQTDMMIEATRLDILTRNINLKAQFSTIQNTCGGYIELPHGTIVSPHFPSTYPPNMDCTWTIQGSKGSFLQLQLVSLDIVKSEHCNEDYLEIRTWSESKILGLYCGSELPSSELTSYERLWIRFHSSPGNIGKGFEITWSYAHLNELVNISRGYIANPPVNMVRDDEEPYAWRIIVKRGEFIELLFKEYNQGLKLYDGYDDTALLVEIQTSPWRFVSSTSVVFLQTDNENFETFSIVWNVTTIKPLSANATLSECHSEQFVKVHRFNGLRVMSPGYPKGYEENMNCEWIFKPFYSVEHVAVKLYDVDLETTGSCSADYLRISTSVDLITWHKQQQLCNGSNVQKWAMESPFMFVDGTPHLKLEFKTDATVNRTGFLAKVVAKCGSNLTDSVGFIDGKMLWDFYDGPNTECVWHVNLKPGKRIKIKLDYSAKPLVKEDFDESCSLHVLLYDGIDDHAPLIKPGKLCYPQNVTVIQSNTTSNHLTIKYKLNFDRVGSKLAHMSYWNLTYREFSDCSQDIRLINEAPEVNITSPQYPNVPHPHTECEWRIVAPQGELLQIEFLERFDMNLRYCTKEHIELFDGSTALARSLGRYCTKPPTLRTTQNMLYVQYLTDIAEPRNGFKARISISKCGGLFDGTYGVITSPGYPGSYPANSQCDFVINLPPNKFMRLSFIDMNLPFDETKLNASDHLEIITIGGPANDTPPMLFYGNTTNTTNLQIASSKAILRFHTYQKTIKHRGFSVRYNLLGTYCSHATEGVSGIISMNLPTKTHFQNVCSWKITVPKMQKARVEFLNIEDFQIENITDNLRFTLYNSVDMTSDIISFNPATFDRNSVIESTDNLIHLRVVVPKTELRLRPLKIRYSSDNDSPCPHNIEADDSSGSIDIPGGRTELMGNFYCGIKIKLNEGETIAFNISTLTVSGYEFALAPLLFRDFYDNTFYRSNLTGFIHAQSKTSGTVAITQNKQGRIHRLKMSYKKYPCGGTIAVNYGQQIKPPSPGSVNLLNGREIVCKWNLFKLHSYVQIISFKLIGNFSFTDSCDKEFLKITTEGVSGSKVDFTFCKDIGNQTFEYELNKVKANVVYRAENYQPERNSFVLSFQQIYSCSMDISVNRYPVTVRLDKAQYKNNQECSWILTARPGEYIQVQFSGRFFIENSPNCTKDYLEIQRDDDGLWLPEARFCGREAPDVYNTSSRRIQIVFRTDDNITADGFELLVNSRCRLRVNVTSNEPTLLVSPGTAENMWRELNCEYEFYGQDPNKLIVVRTRLVDNNIYYAPRYTYTCRFGSMTVYKNQVPGEDNEPVRHCELEFEERAYKYLRLVYNAIRVQKFTVEYAYDSCGGNITTPTIIRPLKHASDDTYADKMECVWYIMAPNEHSIAIRFKYFITEENYDYVSIYSGPRMKTEKLMAKLSGNYTAKTPIMVDSNQAVLTATSDDSNSRKGFEAQIVFIKNCNERIALTDGNSPVTLTRNFKFNSTNEEYLCNYRITAPPGYRIRADIRKLQINSPNSTCQNLQTECNPSICNYLAVLDGSIAMQEIAPKKFCAIASANKTFVSSAEYATLNMNAALPGQYNFEIILTMERTECGLTEYKLGENEKYKFTFPPNGVGLYKAHVHCTWSLIAEKRLDIHFNYIDLQNKSQVSGKCLDYIRVSHIYNEKDLCGQSYNFTLYNQYIYDKKVEITFHSDEAVEGKGFELVVQRSDTCNRTYEFVSSRINYHGYNGENKTCVDIVKVSENYTLSFFINSLYFKNFDCDKLHLKIIDVKTNETLLNRCRNSYLIVNLFTQTNAVRIESAQFSIVDIVYLASERGIIPGCGGLLTLTEAQFSSPPYENDRNFSECRWDIKIPTVSRVELSFKEFNMGSITNCNLDNVKIIEILPNGMEKLYKTLCGSEISTDLQISGTHFAIVSKKSPNFDGTGWTLYYHTIDISNNNDAILINPYA